MAKQSAKSKGYRKTIKKKPFLTKKEILALVIIVAVIALAILLFNLFYDDGYLRDSDVQENDVVTIVSRDVRNRYLKVAEANALDGFTRTDPDRETGTAGDFVYTPEEPTDNISYISLGGSFLDAAELADSSIRSLTSMTEGGALVMSERSDVEVQGHDAYVFSYTNNYYQPPEDAEADAETENEETPESNVFNQSVSLYVNVGEGRTICFHLNFTGEDESYYLSDEEAVDYILDLTDAFTVYDAEEAA